MSLFTRTLRLGAKVKEGHQGDVRIRNQGTLWGSGMLFESKIRFSNKDNGRVFLRIDYFVTCFTDYRHYPIGLL